jgi:hypothetical protein
LSALDGAKSPAPKSQFRERIQADLGCQSWRQNISLYENQKLWYLRHPVPIRGALAIVTNVGRDAVDAAARRASVIAGQVFACERSGSRKTSGAASGRQNRVVLAPVAGVKSAEVRKARPGWQNLNPPATVTRRIRRRGERGISR